MSAETIGEFERTLSYPKFAERLAQLAELKLPERDKTFLKDLNAFYLRSRYPDLAYPPLPHPTKPFTAQRLKRTKEFLVWLQQQ